MWKEVRSRLNEEFGRRRSVHMCYLKAKANDALAFEHVAAAVAAAEAAAAHVEENESSQSQSASQSRSPSASTRASSIFSPPAHPNTHKAFGVEGDGDGDGNGDPTVEKAPLENCSLLPDVIEIFDMDDYKPLSDGRLTQEHTAFLQK